MSVTRISSSVVSSESLISGEQAVLGWNDGAGYFAQAGGYWLATQRPDGGPHVMPLLAVWADGAMHFCTSASSRKGKNLEANGQCVLTASSDGYDLVLEGTACRITDEMQLQRVADAYDAKYGWSVTVRDGVFQDTEGAPTAGPPPYTVYGILPATAFAFGTQEATVNTSTRWRFTPNGAGQ